MTSGYSGTPLAKKLSLRGGMRVWWDGMPENIRDEIAADGLRLEVLEAPEAPIDEAHVFVTSRSELETKLRALMPLLDRAGMIWVSWPKRSSKVSTDISEHIVRDIALPMHLVDVKVCSVDDIWSGLKLVIRKERR
jgi:hypothetical protein